MPVPVCKQPPLHQYHRHMAGSAGLAAFEDRALIGNCQRRAKPTLQQLASNFTLPYAATAYFGRTDLLAVARHQRRIESKFLLNYKRLMILLYARNLNGGLAGSGIVRSRAVATKKGRPM